MKHFDQYYFSAKDQAVAKAIKPAISDVSQAVTLIDRTFVRTIQQSLAATAHDKKIGVLLSGGVDSSLLVAMLRRLTDKPIVCFTAMTETDDPDVLPSKHIAETFDTKWVKCVLKTKDLDKRLAELLPASQGGLYATAADLAMDACLRACQKHGVTTLWAGNGLDMLFGGGVEASRFAAENPAVFHRKFWQFSMDLLVNRFYEQDGRHMDELAGHYGVRVIMPFENLDTIVCARSFDATLNFQHDEDKYPIRLLAHRYGVPFREAKRKKEPLQSSSGIFGLLREYMYETLPDLTHDAVNFRLTEAYFESNPNTDLQIFLTLLSQRPANAQL